MERAQEHRLKRFLVLRKQLFRALLHFSRRLVRKGDGDDILRLHAAVQQSSQPARQCLSLPRSCTRNDQERAFAMFHRRALFIIQFFKMYHKYGIAFSFVFSILPNYYSVVILHDYYSTSTALTLLCPQMRAHLFRTFLVKVRPSAPCRKKYYADMPTRCMRSVSSRITSNAKAQSASKVKIESGL